jgi:hypothetical protein
LYTSARAFRAELAEPELRQHGADLGSDLARAQLAQLEAIRDVVEHALVRPQRIRLEHQPEVALLGRQLGAAGAVEYAALADVDAAQAWRLEPGDGAQQGGLAAAGRPQQRHHFAALQVHRDALQDLVGLGPAAVVEMQVVDG